jgi:hypothetical protein
MSARRRDDDAATSTDPASVGAPITGADRLGHVYVLCFDPPRAIDSVSRDYPHAEHHGDERFGYRSLPLRHYVGWTGTYPWTRLDWHGLERPYAELVDLFHGTLADEQRTKDTGTCPRCGGSLNPGVS